MTDLLSAAQMRALEQAAIAAGTVTGLDLMERAGRGVVEAIFAAWPALGPKRGLLRWLNRPKKAVVFCGPGNNGGDGFVIARRLQDAGLQVETYLFGDPGALPPDAKHTHDLWRAKNPVHHFGPDKARDPMLCEPPPDLWIDAIFGIGQTRPLPDLVTQMLHRVYYEQNWCRAPVVSVDVPTGLSSDTGRSVQPFHLTADMTVTFHQKKPGHLIEDGPERCGQIVTVDIGL